MSAKNLATLAGPVGWKNQMATVELRMRDRETALAGIRAAFSELDEKSRLGKRALHLVQASQAVNPVSKRLGPGTGSRR